MFWCSILRLSTESDRYLANLLLLKCLMLHTIACIGTVHEMSVSHILKKSDYIFLFYLLVWCGLRVMKHTYWLQIFRWPTIWVSIRPNVISNIFSEIRLFLQILRKIASRTSLSWRERIYLSKKWFEKTFANFQCHINTNLRAHFEMVGWTLKYSTDVIKRFKRTSQSI